MLTAAANMIDQPARSKIEVIPAILPKSFDDLQAHVERVRGVATKIQIDVVDGSFAHNTTWPYRDRSTFEKIVSEEHGLPFWDEIDYEFDLMINDPQEHVLDYAHAAASRIIVHGMASGADEAMGKLADLKDDDFGEYSIKIGVAIPADNGDEDPLVGFETTFDFVQVMGISKIGFQGQPFDPRSIEVVKKLRRIYPSLQIQVDGAVTLQNARELVAAGANRLVVGSAIFAAEDPKAAFQALYTEANAH